MCNCQIVRLSRLTMAALRFFCRPRPHLFSFLFSLGRSVSDLAIFLPSDILFRQSLNLSSPGKPSTENGEVSAAAALGRCAAVSELRRHASICALINHITDKSRWLSLKDGARFGFPARVPPCRLTCVAFPSSTLVRCRVRATPRRSRS